MQYVFPLPEDLFAAALSAYVSEKNEELQSVGSTESDDAAGAAAPPPSEDPPSTTAAGMGAPAKVGGGAPTEVFSGPIWGMHVARTCRRASV